MMSTQGQTFYAISDGANAPFNAAAELPAGISFPIRRSMLAADTNSLVGPGGTRTRRWVGTKTSAPAPAALAGA